MQLPERVAVVEEKLDSMEKSLKDLSVAVNSLVKILNGAKGVVWVVGIFGAIATGALWILDHISIRR